jgi:hypothetical protein
MGSSIRFLRNWFDFLVNIFCDELIDQLIDCLYESQGEQKKRDDFEF